MMTRDYELIDSIEMLEKAIQRMDIAENGAPYILDWSHATQGNASADVARTYLLFSLAGDVSGANTYLDLFCKKSDTAKQYVQKWMPIVAASQSVKGNEKENNDDIVIIPSYLTKGLEFDATIIYNPSKENYSDTLLDQRLLYVSLTRALHYEYIIEIDNLSSMIK